MRGKPFNFAYPPGSKRRGTTVGVYTAEVHEALKEVFRASEAPKREENKEGQALSERVVEAATGLPEEARPVTTGGKVITTDVMEETAKVVGWEHNFFLKLGRAVRYELAPDVKLSEDELKDTDKAMRKYMAFIQTLLKFREDAKAYDRLMAENVVARGAIRELQIALNNFKMGFEVCASAMCEACRRRPLYTMAMRASMKEGGEIKA